MQIKCGAVTLAVYSMNANKQLTENVILNKQINNDFFGLK